jgi:hypothetical protein
VKVSAVESRTSICRRATARDRRQAEAEREKRAKIIHAAGEFEASAKLSQAANVIAAEPVAITLRYLQTLTEIAAEKIRRSFSVADRTAAPAGQIAG